MDRSDPKDRQTIARLGGETAQQNRRLAYTPEQRSEQARQLGERVLELKGKAHYRRMALIRWGKLPSPTQKAGTAIPANHKES